MLKSSWPNQERNNLELWSVHTIPDIHPEVQHIWHFISKVSFNIFKKKKKKKEGKKKGKFLLGWDENFLVPT